VFKDLAAEDYVKLSIHERHVSDVCNHVRPEFVDHVHDSN
jgi:hypothetical protein